MTPGARPGAGALSTLRRISADRPRAAPGERCEMCAEPITERHQHVVALDTRALLCTCRPCYLLFTDQAASLRYRAVPDRYLSFPGSAFDAAAWENLQIPVGLAFMFRNSVQDRVVVFYPSPAGATESELAPADWERLLAADPRFATLLPDVEALLVRRAEPHPRRAEEFLVHLVPIDACYELVGRMRMTWRGFDGGQEARAAMDEFFAAVDARSRTGGPGGAS